MNLEVKEKEVQIRELQEQVSILDARCQSQQEELQGMSEQLTEVSVLLQAVVFGRPEHIML